MSITQLPPAPSRTDPATFSTRADTFVAALPTFVTEANATAANVTAKENQSEASAAAAASSEAAAAASENQALEYRNEAVAASGAVLWVAGTSYAIGDGVVSPTNFKSYRDKVGGVSNTDPANDSARWLILEVSRLEAIATTKAVTAVDVFVYDTSKDSDGGAWRKRCQHTSWYNEPLNTATRGARREFPAVAVIVGEARKITVYDGDDPALPMWIVFQGGTSGLMPQIAGGYPVTSVIARDGEVYAGHGTGLFRCNFISDRATNHEGSPYTSKRFTNNIAQRSAASFVEDASIPALMHRSVNDVAMTVLPNAPIDAATGLPVPTIAVATAGGVSVINNDGTVADSTQTVAMLKGWLGDNNRLFYSDDSSDQVYYTDTYAADGFNSGGTHYDTDAAPYTLAGNVVAGVNGAFGHADGVTFLHENPTTPANGMVAYTTSTYNTGWMTGDIKGAFLSDTDNTDLVGGTDADRSVNANPLTVNGTITRTPVATGADLVGYSGFSETNYLEGTDATYADTLYALGWEQTAGVWEFKHGVVSAAPIDGLTITGTTLKIAGTKPKALVRVTATTPSTAQLAKIQADERFLFQADAACTLYGASDAVTALAHDPDTGLLHVGTSAGRSVFQGLRRVSNTTTAVGTAISASNGLVVEE